MTSRCGKKLIKLYALLHCRNTASNRTQGLRELLTPSVFLNETVICLSLSENFETLALKFKNTKSHIDRDFKMQGLLELCVENNDNFLTKCLYKCICKIE